MYPVNYGTESYQCVVKQESENGPGRSTLFYLFFSFLFFLRQMSAKAQIRSQEDRDRTQGHGDGQCCRSEGVVA